MKTIIKRSIVIVIDTANYKSSYSEGTPFKAKVMYNRGDVTWLKSMETGKNYELYSHQILEGLDIEQIKELIDMSKYGL